MTAEGIKLAVAIAAVLISLASFVIARRADARSKRAEAIKNLLGEKETVAFAGLKLARDGLPAAEDERRLVISAIVQACVFERSGRARALLYRVIDTHRDYAGEFTAALAEIEATFDRMRELGFTPDELDLDRGFRRVEALRKVVSHTSDGAVQGP